MMRKILIALPFVALSFVAVGIGFFKLGQHKTEQYIAAQDFRIKVHEFRISNFDLQGWTVEQVEMYLNLEKITREELGLLTKRYGEPKKELGIFPAVNITSRKPLFLALDYNKRPLVPTFFVNMEELIGMVWDEVNKMKSSTSQMVTEEDVAKSMREIVRCRVAPRIYIELSGKEITPERC